MKSIIVDDTSVCIVCGRPYAEEHHVFFGVAYRKLSEKYGLKVGLCYRHHRQQPTGVHGGNRELDLALKRTGQRAFIRKFPDLDFTAIFDKNYL